MNHGNATPEGILYVAAQACPDRLAVVSPKGQGISYAELLDRGLRTARRDHRRRDHLPFAGTDGELLGEPAGNACGTAGRQLPLGRPRRHRRGRWTVAFMGVPLNLPGELGSPANAVALL